MEQANVKASPKLRGVFFAATFIMLAIWGREPHPCHPELE
jgi:hypothetical protein